MLLIADLVWIHFFEFQKTIFLHCIFRHYFNNKYHKNNHNFMTELQLDPTKSNRPSGVLKYSTWMDIHELTRVVPLQYGCPTYTSDAKRWCYDNNFTRYFTLTYIRKYILNNVCCTFIQLHIKKWGYKKKIISWKCHGYVI